MMWKKLLCCAAALMLLSGQAGAVDFLTRGEFIALLCDGGDAVGDVGEFEDVSPLSPYYEAVSAARAMGIVEGDGTRFYPDQLLSRQDTAVFAWRWLTREGRETEDALSLASFSDGGDVADYAAEAMLALHRLGLLPAKDGRLRPLATLERAEASELLRALSRAHTLRDNEDARRAVLEALSLPEAEVEMSPRLTFPDRSEIYCAVYTDGKLLCRARVLYREGELRGVVLED